MNRTDRNRLLRLALANSTGFSATTAVPLWIGLIAPLLGVASSWPSVIASLQLACAAAGNIGASMALRRHPAEKIAVVAALISSAGSLLAAIPLASSFAVGCAINGAALGVLLSATNRIVATTEAVHEGYSLLMVVEVMFAASFYIVMPLVIRQFGLASLFLMLMLLGLTVAALMRGLSASASQPRNVCAADNPGSSGRAMLMLLAFAIFFSGQSAVWSRVLSIGALLGLDAVQVGRVMALSVLTGLLGAMLAKLIGERFGITKPLLASCALLGAVLLINVHTTSTLLFAVSATCIMLLTMFTVPYVFTSLARLDRSGRWASAGPAFLLIGTAIGPSIAAYTLNSGTFSDVGKLACILVLAAAAMFVGGSVWRSTQMSSAARRE